MSEQATTVYGVWNHDWESDDLIGLYHRKEDAERCVEDGPRSSPDSGEPAYNVEELVVRGET